MQNKLIILFLRNMKIGSSLSMRLTKLTGKSPYNTHPKHLIGQKENKQWILEHIKPTDVVLDIGCNDGSISKLVAKKCRELVGIDVNKEILEVAEKRLKRAKLKNFKLQIVNAENALPFKNGQFDVVVAIDVIEHISQYEKAIADINRILKPKGKFLLAVPNVETSWKKMQKDAGLFYYSDPDHKIEFTSSQIKKILEKQNFKVVSLDTTVFDTPLAPLIDILGGLSLSLYRKLSVWKQNYARSHPKETSGWKIVCSKI